ncbi:MAG: NifU family protein [Acidimicrobiia bacterium]
MSDAPILTLTSAAREKLLEMRADEPTPESLALWLEVNSEPGNEYGYDMFFGPVDEASASDQILSCDDLSVVVGGDSAEMLRGSTLDFADGGMVLRNPNDRSSSPGPASRVTADLSGSLAQRILQVLNESVNPQIAAHGGHVDLVAVEEPIAYVHLSGGCQGCGLAAATLREGIEVAIIDAVPEIAEVLDVTDHASGTNPYYTADQH